MATNQVFRRVPTQVHTRKLDRSVAHHNMEIAELQGVNDGNPSYFARHWRDTVVAPSHIYSRRNKK